MNLTTLALPLGLLGAAVFSLGTVNLAAGAPPAGGELPSAAGAPDDFDFYLGTWKVTHRRLKSRLTGCTEWEQFPGISSVRSLLGGFANVDDNVLELPSGTYRAATLRAFDPKAGTWSIWWLDGRNPHALDVPVVGKFVDRVGTFFARDTLNGRAIVVRFTWTQPRPGHPHWEQAFSADDGATWETNWTMDFERR